MLHKKSESTNPDGHEQVCLSADDTRHGHPEGIARYYERFSKGGFGLVITKGLY